MKRRFSIAVFMVTATLAVVSWFLLPDHVVVQIGISGKPTNTGPKIMALLLPLAISLIGIFMNGPEEKKAGKGLIVQTMAMMMLVVTLAVNL